MRLRRINPGPYAWAINLLVSLVSVAIGMIVIFHIADRQVKAERAAREQQQAAQAAQGELAHRATCILINAQNDAYQAEPPNSPTGIKAAKAWHDLSVQFHC